MSLRDTARIALNLEAQALQKASERLDSAFEEAIQCLSKIEGRIICTGLGKSGHIARKISATLASTGTPSLFLHPSEALHGDLGMVTPKDALLAIAFGGETAEVLDVVRFAVRSSLPVVSITGKPESTLAKMSRFVIDGSVEKEVCPLNLAPTTSSTLALALGDAIAVCLMEVNGFKEEQFADFHPSGSLGRKFKSVGDLSRDDLVSVPEDAPFSAILDAMHVKNYGLIGVSSNDSRVTGVVSDGDLRRAVGKHQEKVFQLTAKEIMTVNPKSIPSHALAIEAVAMMEKFKNTVLIVEDSEKRKVPRIIRMHDLVEAKLI